MRTGDVVADRFEVERLAGAGGMAQVFRARDKMGGEPVALKLLLDGPRVDAERFRREAELLASLRHPAIVAYVAHGIDGGQRWLATEWLEGVDLSVRLEAGPLPLGGALELGRRTAEALGLAHARGVTHRDIKPGNLFLVGGEPERVKILDFGIARQAAAHASSTRTGTVVGTPGYMAPEQVRGASSVDARADVFSLGCVLFHCITGHPPFFAEHVMAMLAKILLEDVPRLGAFSGGVSPQVEDLVARMMAKDAADRPRDGLAVAAAIGAVEAQATSRSTSPAAAPPASLGASERRLLCLVVAGKILALAPTLPRTEIEAAESDPSPVETVAARHGGRFERLADGSVLVTLSGSGSATDQVARGARCALDVRDLVAEAPIALATGRGQIDGAVPVGEVIDRAITLLRRPASADAAPRAIHIDEVTAGLLDAQFEIGGGGEGLVLRGRRERVEAARTVLGKVTPFVGRERELALLEGAVAEVIDEPVARAVLVTGPAGVGKSRLRHELVESLRRRGGVELWVARGDPLRAGVAFGLLAPALRTTMGIQEGEAAEVARRKVRARVARNDSTGGADAERIAELVGEIVGVPFPDEASPRLRAARADPQLMAEQVRSAWNEWLRAECGAQPVALVLDDLHWADAPTLRLVDDALGALAEQPLFVVAFARPEVAQLFGGLWASRHVQELRLGELTKKSGARLARAALGSSVSDETVDAIVAQSAGNAFFLEEIIRAVARGHGDRLPETVVAMVQARLESLEGDARRVLRAASVFGLTFWQGGVAALVGEHAGAGVASWLAELVDRELVTARGEGRFPGQRELAFRNELVREAAYAMLTDADRGLGHRLAAAWLEAVGERDALVLATHRSLGGEPERAALWYARAARQSLEAGDLDLAEAQAARVTAVASDDGSDGRTALGQAALVLAEVHRWRGRHGESDNAAVLAARALPPGTEGWFFAVSYAALARARLGKRVEVERAARWVLDTPKRTTADRYARVVTLGRVAWACTVQSSPELARALLAEAEREGAELGESWRRDPHIAGVLARTRGAQAAWLGDLGSAAVAWEQAVGAGIAVGNVREAVGQSVNLGFAFVALGQHERAERVLREALARADEAGIGTVVAAAKQNLGVALARRGALDEAVAVQLEARDAFLRQGDVRLEGGSSIYLSQALLARGELDAAEIEARRAVDRLSAIPAMRACARAALADVLSQLGRKDEALGAARAAQADLSEAGGVEEGEALVGRVLVEALLAAGRTEEGRAALSAARDRLLQRAAKIVDESWRRSFLENVPDNARLLENV